MYYFDWTATTKISEDALKEYIRVSEDYYGNPSSIHEVGIEAKNLLENCRLKISEILKTDKNNLFFTSGGTESNSIILNSLLKMPVPGEIITTGIEHSAILEHKATLESYGWKFTTLLCPKGFLNPDTLKKALNDKVKMVCVMAVNNVIGSIQPIEECCRIIRDYSKETNKKIHIHCDAVQALGKIPFDLSLLDIDSASFSAHKIYGPKGIGILFNRNKSLLSLSKGGGQESGLRPGTENLPAIAAMTKAITIANDNISKNYNLVLSLHNMLVNFCLNNGYDLLSPIESHFSPYIVTISNRNIPAEVFLRMMSDKGFCLSAGSACSSQSKSKTESVLAAMNISPDLRRGAVRISLGINNTEEEILKLINALKEIKEEIK